MNKDKIDAKILAVAGKGGVGKTSLAAVIVKLLVAAYPGYLQSMQTRLWDCLPHSVWT